ncbi:hypothetical protein PILCRDRAFT_10209 [Piloderma croceum F 1598]|uniref:NACHT domain-containing protein n=1 Tax=Piloderma croceum (strain F 1598) TaxID=765440 RepID=A0A0C3FJS2_PILCF|nr:hypothetical protein PILCRDRAFT_10209 [Piloderma croceum F 1598]
MPPRRSNQAASSSQAVSSRTISSRPRFFARPSDINIDARHGVFTNVTAMASNVDARYGFINNVAGDMHIVQNIDLFLLDKLPYVKGAGYRSGNHELCLTGTREAVLKSIEDWEADSTTTRVYWLSGVAGSGKSTIAQTFAESADSRSRLGASFFCSRDFDDRRNIRLIIPTLAYHLAHQYPEFKDAIIPIISSNPDIGHESLSMQLNHLLVQPLKSVQLSTTIIIDALDECEEDQPASAILSILAQHIDAIPSVKFFITARPELSIRTAPSTAASTHRNRYLRIHLSELAAQRLHWDTTVPWPSDQQIVATVNKCAGLFIVAHVIVKFVRSRHHQPQERLDLIIGSPDTTVYEGRSGIDVTYRQILLQSFKGIDIDDTDCLEQLRLVIGSVVLALNPLSCASLTALLRLPSNRVWNVMDSLHSVFLIPDSELEPMRICHKSVADFFTDPSRCTDPRFYIDPSVSHFNLATSCFVLMNQFLRTNICHLPAYVMNEDIHDLGERRKKYIGDVLEYACRSWARHLHFVSRASHSIRYVVELLELFFRSHLLSWLEVLSIVGDLRCAVYSIGDVRTWLGDIDLPDTNLLELIQDCERFVLRFFDPIEVSAVHIYHSALPWSPMSSLVLRLYRNHIWTEAKVIKVMNDSWDAYTRAIYTRSISFSIALSHKDDLIAAGEKTCVEIFEVVTGQRRATLAVCKKAKCVAFSPDDTLLVNGCADGTIDLWDLQTCSIVTTLIGHTKSIDSIAFSPCGSMIASSTSDHTIRIWSVSSHNRHFVLQTHSKEAITCVCWTATGRQVISGSQNGNIRIWDISEKKCLRMFHIQGRPHIIACSPDSSFIAFGFYDDTCAGVQFVNALTGSVVSKSSTDSFVTSIRFLNREKVLYTDLSTFVIQHPTKMANKLVFGFDGQPAVISSDGACIVSKSFYDSQVVKIWHTGSMKQIRDETHLGEPGKTSVSFSGDGRLIASWSEESLEAKLWDATEGLCLHTFSEQYGPELIFSPNSTLIASVLNVWDVQTGRLVTTLNNPLHCCQMEFSPNGNQLVVIGEDYVDSPGTHIKLLDVETGACLASMPVDNSSIYVNFGVDGTSIILNLGLDSEMAWRIAPALISNGETYIDDESSNDYDYEVSDDDSSEDLPMIFIPVYDQQRSVSPNIPLQQDLYEPE